MAENLKTLIQGLRTGSTAEGGLGQSNLLSKLQIGASLYHIKDPAVEALAEQVESRLSAIETSTIRETALTKDATAGKFATSVTQGTDGQISVSYSDIRSTALEDTAVDGQFITTVSQGTDGQVSIARAGVTASQVGFTSAAGFTSTTVQGALEELHTADVNLIGATTDAATALTIYGARAYADSLVNNLAGEDWAKNAKTVKEIIQEIEGSTATSTWTTMVDKLAGMTYIPANATEAVTASSVSEYVEARIAAVNAQNAEGINGLDAVIFGAVGAAGSTGDAAATAYTGATQTVAIKITEVDGKLTAVDVKTNDIASATALSALDAEAVKSVNGATGNTVVLTGADIDLSGSTATKLDAYVTNLNSIKANKAAITSTTVNDWAAPTYTAGTETLSWTSTGITVYVPASGETL